MIHIHPMRTVTSALLAALVCSVSGLSAQDPEPVRPAKPVLPPESVRPPKAVRPPRAVTKPELHGRRQNERVQVHVRKMLALAEELREGGFEEEAQVLVHQARRLVLKTRGPAVKRRRHSTVETIEEVQTRNREGERHYRPLKLARAAEVDRSRAEHEMARRKNEIARRDRASMAGREEDLNRRVEHLTMQVMALQDMVQDLRSSLDRIDKRRRRGPVGR